MTKAVHIWSVLAVLLCLCGCGGGVDVVRERVDSLNMAAYGIKYASLPKARLLAEDAMATARGSGYTDGLHEALLNRGDIYGMSMRYDSAQWCYKQVLAASDNDLLCGVADVDMMSVCLMLSMSKEFYDYRSDAQERFDRLQEASGDMNGHQQRVWNAVQAQYHFVSVNYFMKMRQDDGVRTEMEWLEANQHLFADDTTQVSAYLFLRSMFSIQDGKTDDALDGMQRSLVRLLSMSRQNGNAYFEASALNSLARSILAGRELKPSRRVFLEELLGPDADLKTGEALAKQLALRAEQLAGQYGNDFVRTTALVTLSDFYLQTGEDSLALVQMETALDLINRNHQQMNPANREVLYVYSPVEDSLSTEMKWIADPEVVAVPEWMAMVREQLSVLFGAMGMKAESDYNHNLYFDILDVTRQDQRVEQEKDNLNREERTLNALLWLFGVAFVVLVWGLYAYNARSRREYKEKVQLLGSVVDVCKRLSAMLSDDVEDEEELDRRLHSVTDEEVGRLFPSLQGSDWTQADYRQLKGLDGELLHVLLVFYEWVRQRGLQFLGFAEERRRLEGETYVLEKRFEQSKRQYVEKLTSMSIVNGITPFLDRALHEVGRLKMHGDAAGEEVKERLAYLSELINKINDYNDVLGHWVKVRQGMVTLNVESFPLRPLFDTLRRGAKTFDIKGVTLDVAETDCVVKADKALTLFMMNTLLDNARKYTPKGGRVSLCADEGADYVEISVRDTGLGMSAEDVETLNNAKVYDSGKIGISGTNAEAVREQKGFGFGLMNCKGIIGKYKKTNALFSVCDFGVESTLGQGSRFHFRLPKGAVKGAMALALLFASVGARAESALEGAARYADSLYASNVQGEHERAVLYADSAIRQLNAHYLEAHPQGKERMTLEGPEMAELEWWHRGEETDYELMIGIRNEVAIAALALNRNGLYHYNNEVFTRLYKLMSTNPDLENYCNDIRAANRNKKTLLILLGILILGVVVTYFLMHYRHHQLFIFNLRQFIQLNGRVFTAVEEDFLSVLRQNLSDIKQTDVVGLMLPEGGDGQRVDVVFSGEVKEREATEALMYAAQAQGAEVVSSNGCFHAYPLYVPGMAESTRPMGVMGVRYSDGRLTAEEGLIVDLVRQFVSIHSYFSRLRVGEMNEMLELKRDERQKTENEQGRVYVRNQIMDNCLSTLKHETMYYPNRIKQIVDAALADGTGCVSAKTVEDIDELLSYYKEIFSILSACAGKQVEKVLYRRVTLSAEDVGGMARKAFERQRKKARSHASIRVAEAAGLRIQGDRIFLQTLLDNIVSLFFEHQSGGDLVLDFDVSDGFAIFAFTDTAYRYTEEELPLLFYVDNVAYDAATDRLKGAQYLLCRQIIREHDAHAARRGCRIYAENVRQGQGSRFVFTLPQA